MSDRLRSMLSLILCWLLILPPLPAAVIERQERADPIQQTLQRSYIDLFEHASEIQTSAVVIEQVRRRYERAEKECVKTFSDRAKALGRELESVRRDLRRRSARLDESERHDLHCRVQNLEVERRQMEMFARHAVPLAYENRQAKLDLLEQWPTDLQNIRKEKASGAYRNRPFGDVEDIGFREIIAGQEKDVERGQRAIDEIRRLGMIPRELDNQVVADYANTIATRVARGSDLRVPLKLTVLDSPEINAFALPGGFLFLNRGLLEAAEDEAQLAGVIAHEIAHVTARHGNRLMRRATIASIIYQAAQIGAIIATGGAIGLGAYYALQYGFYGLGLALNLDLLGVSREFELEADQLGVQYAWKSGYDPTGFIRFFDKMAHQEGYVRGASWFRTHPPFFARMMQTQREIQFLPERESYVVQTPDFLRIKAELERCAIEARIAEQETPCRPTLMGPRVEDCPEPRMIDFKAGDPVEALCRAAEAWPDSR